MGNSIRSAINTAILYGIVDAGYVLPEAMETRCRELIAGGADVIQLRAKTLELRLIEDLARRLLPICREAEVPFIVNDFPELAASIGVDGVHIGQDDGSIQKVRESVGEEMLIGRSTHSLEQARQALKDGADYIGFGPLFPTPTKKGRPAIGLENIATMEREVGSKIPAFCIGGINPKNLREIKKAGAKRCVIVSALLTAADVSSATQAAKEVLLKP